MDTVEEHAGAGIRSQVMRFAAVGGLGFLLDAGVFNLLRVTVLAPSTFHQGPLLAKVISTAVAIMANWLGNRYWTFSGQRNASTAREALEFVAVSLLGMLVAVACLAVSRYVLGLTSLLADNVSSNGIGLLLGSSVRFALYRYWVYGPHRGPRRRVSAALR